MNKKLPVLVACEESQVVCLEFRKLGIESFSCDLVSCSGSYPEYHILCDVLEVLNGHCFFKTMDNKIHHVDEWGLIIAHPPCTYLSKASARFLYPKAGQIDLDRLKAGLAARDFFMKFYYNSCNHICIENPTPLKIFNLPRYSQIIQPYNYGDPFSKRTLLWLKNLPPILPTNILSEYIPFCPSNTSNFSKGFKGSFGVAHTKKDRSKTFKGIAQAMANQWVDHIPNY